MNAGTNSNSSSSPRRRVGYAVAPARRFFALALTTLLSACGRPADVEWPLYGGGAAEQRFAELEQIDVGNVSQLGFAWSFEDFVVRGRTQRGNEATPLVVGGVMYLSGPWSVLYALDARTGRSLWTYDPEVDGLWARKTCCDAISRGVAYANGRIYSASLDGYLTALDARDGRVLWRADTFTDRAQSYAITGAPRIAGSSVVIGNGGGEMGVRGYVTAYDLETGAQKWRFFTVPGDPRAGPDEHPEVTLARPTWSPNSRWDLGGGGTAWDSMTYDPDSNLLFVGVGNGSPHPGWVRSPGGGDNLFLSSIVALDADTGRMRWYYQTTPGDSWDYTATQNMILADLDFGGRTRQVIMQAPKNGFFYVLDRLTGELLSAQPYTTVTWADLVDLRSGRPVINQSSDFSRQPRVVWPSEAGGHNWNPMAFSRETGYVYIPTLDAPMEFNTVSDVPFRPDSVVQGVQTRFPNLPQPNGPVIEGFRSVLKAWDPVAGRTVWEAPARHFWNGGGVLATSGGLVFQGATDGTFNAYDARHGTLLHSIQTGSAIQAAPITYTLDGVQYVAVLAGYGGAFNWGYLPGVVARERENLSRVLVFRLGGGDTPLPPLRSADVVQPRPETTANAATIARGQALYAENCGRCHGRPGLPGGYPDLWNMSPATHAAFNDIVQGGSLRYAGMASFADVLSSEDITAIHAFLSSSANADRARAVGPAR